MRNRNFKIEDKIHARLKILAAARGETIGKTIGFLLTQDFLRSMDRLTSEIRNSTIEKKSETIEIMEKTIALKDENNA